MVKSETAPVTAAVVRPSLKRSIVLQQLPAVLAFALLIGQAVTPWMTPRVVTQDGPSHVYGATIVRDLVFHHKTSPYSPLYTIQKGLVPNWTSTIVLGFAEFLVGPKHAQQLFISCALIAAFLAWSYALSGICSRRTAWTPLTNFLIQTWFIWVIGFYNFYLGMALLGIPIGFYARRSRRLTWPSMLALTAGLIVLFFTHLVAAVIAVLALVVTALWIHIVSGRSDFRRFSSDPGIREFVKVALAVAPVTAMILIYLLHQPNPPAHFEPRILWTLSQFPLHVFTTGDGRTGMELMLWPLLVFYMVAGLIVMERPEWLSVRGGLALAAAILFLVFLLVPDAGFEGNDAKIRLSWGVCLLGTAAIYSVRGLRSLRIPISVWISFFVFANLISIHAFARSVNAAATDYLNVARNMPPRSSFVRIQFPKPRTAARYGYQELGMGQLFHFDAEAAAERGLIDLSDYEAMTRLFPVVYKARIERSFQFGMWGFETGRKDSAETLAWLRGNFPIPIDFVLLVGDEQTPEAIQAGMPHMKEYLDGNMQLKAQSPDATVRLYARRDLRTISP